MKFILNKDWRLEGNSKKDMEAKNHKIVKITYSICYKRLVKVELFNKISCS